LAHEHLAVTSRLTAEPPALAREGGPTLHDGLSDVLRRGHGQV